MSIGKGRWLVGLLLAATIWGFVDVRRRAYPHPESPEEHKTDLTVYTEAGAAFFDGGKPYEVRNPRGWTYVYPPILALLLAPLARLAHAGPVDRLVLSLLGDVLGRLSRMRADRGHGPRSARRSGRRPGAVDWLAGSVGHSDRGLAHLELPATRPGQRRQSSTCCCWGCV